MESLLVLLWRRCRCQRCNARLLALLPGILPPGEEFLQILSSMEDEPDSIKLLLKWMIPGYDSWGDKQEMTCLRCHLHQQSFSWFCYKKDGEIEWVDLRELMVIAIQTHEPLRGKQKEWIRSPYTRSEILQQIPRILQLSDIEGLNSLVSSSIT